MDKADIIIKNYEDSVKHFDKCIKAGLCPQCYADLELQSKEITVVKKRGLIFKKYDTISTDDTKVICPNNHPLIHPIYGDRSYIGCVCWSSTINKTIRYFYNQQEDISSALDDYL